MLLVLFLYYYLLGGMGLIKEFLSSEAPMKPGDRNVLLLSITVFFPLGAVFGVRLWGRMIRKLGWLDESKIKNMIV